MNRVVWAKYPESKIYFEKFQLQDKMEGKGKKVNPEEYKSEGESEKEGSVKGEEKMDKPPDAGDV